VRRALKFLPASLLLAALGALAGCGGAAGVSSGATVSVYISAPLSGVQSARGQRICASAKAELARREAGASAPSVRIRALCLDDTGGARQRRLAAIGEGARRAVEDSSTVAYIGELEPAATRFSRPIVEAAGIGQAPGPSGKAAMARVLDAIEAAGETGQLREAVKEELDG
jgi:hypothetical protein